MYRRVRKGCLGESKRVVQGSQKGLYRRVRKGCIGESGKAA